MSDGVWRMTSDKAAATGDGAAVGDVVTVSGSRVTVRLSAEAFSRQDVTVGRFVGVGTVGSRLVGVVTSVAGDATVSAERAAGGRPATCQIDVMGEIARSASGRPSYRRGAVEYPAIGAAATFLTPAELGLIFAHPGEATIRIGHLHQDATLPAEVRVNDMLAKHFAILGSTGVGKSSGVSVIVGEILRARPDLRVFFIDPHNEYGTCFGASAEVLTPTNLRLPFWLFNFEEFVDVLFRGRPGREEETEILSELVPQAKALFAGIREGAERSALRRAETKSSGIHPDTPVPYRLADLIGLIEERRGKLDNRAQVGSCNRLLGRIDAVRQDPRYAFMFESATVGGDTMAEVIGQLFRIPSQGRPLTVMQLAGFPSEVVDSVVSVVCRMAFELGLWSDGALPTLLVCEEAHRYAPADRSLGFGPTRKALSRIAKEGRKYGVFLGLVTQRPAELDGTIVSQCNTVFAMRMANDRDQAILRAAVSDAAASLLEFVPALGTREVFAFGEGVAMPTRLRFSELPAERLPRSQADGRGPLRAGEPGRDLVATVVERWRNASGGRPRPPEDDPLPAQRPSVPGRPVLPQAGDPGWPAPAAPPPRLPDLPVPRPAPAASGPRGGFGSRPGV